HSACPVAIVAIPLSFGFVIALSKVVELAIGTAMQSRVGLEISAMVYAMLISLSFIWLPIGLVASQRASGSSPLVVVPSIGDIARMLPSGWGVVAVEAAARGKWALMLVALVALGVLTLLLVVAGAALIARRLGGANAEPHHQVRRLRLWDSVTHTVVPRTPVGAVIVKELRAWTRHPRRVLTLHVAVWSALLLCVVPGFFG